MRIKIKVNSECVDTQIFLFESYKRAKKEMIENQQLSYFWTPAQTAFAPAYREIESSKKIKWKLLKSIICRAFDLQIIM